MISARKRVFQDILYSQCWEDSSMDRKAFRITPQDTVFSITSGGCNALAFLIDRPKSVVALDINPFQNFLLELKAAAFKTLTHGELLEFVGVRPSSCRRTLYRRLRPSLSTAAAGYWDTEQSKIDQGIINCGRYEEYMALLRRWIHRVKGRNLIEEFYRTTERAKLYDRKWDTLWWKAFTRVLLSRTTMSMLFDKAFFRYLDRRFSFGKHFAARVRRAFTELPMKENYFLAYILRGNYWADHLPPYLRPENFEPIRENLHKLVIVNDDCVHYFASLPDSCIRCFNFTNIFEWMSPAAYEELLKSAYRVGSDGAILTYRNLLVSRERPDACAERFESLRDEAKKLHNEDLSFIYSNYVVERIRKGVEA